MLKRVGGPVIVATGAAAIVGLGENKSYYDGITQLGLNDQKIRAERGEELRTPQELMGPRPGSAKITGISESPPSIEDKYCKSQLGSRNGGRNYTASGTKN